MNGDTIKTHVFGPNIAKLMSRELARTEMDIKIFSGNETVEINVDGKKFIANIGRWSEWVEVKFKLGMMKTTSGIVKFYLNQIKPEFELYMTAVQVNPKDPAFVISSPDDYIKELADNLGYFYTQGMPEDTKALEEGRIDEEAFITMCDEIVDEQEKMLWHEFNRFKDGLLAATFFQPTGYNISFGLRKTHCIRFIINHMLKDTAMLLMTIIGQWTGSLEK